MDKTRRLTAAAACVVALSGPALAADPETAEQMREMRAEIDALKNQVQTLSTALSKAQKSGFGRQPAAAPRTAAAASPAAQPQGPPTRIAPIQGGGGALASAAAPAVKSEDVPTRDVPASAQPVSPTTLETTTLPSQANTSPSGFFEKRAGKTLTFGLPGGEITAYGNIDVSLDDATKGYPDASRLHGTNPVGRRGWLPDISTNLSFVGVRGYETIPDQPFRFVYQFETQLDVSAASGTAETNNSQSNVVKSGLTSRNTYVGLSNPDWGSILVGKTDAPYKTSTARMNPFVGEWGDYSVIMGNTGGDNRVEFGTRLDHSI